MKIIKPSLCVFAYLAVVAISPDINAAEFNCAAEQLNCLYDSVSAANQTSGPDIIRFAEGTHFSVEPHPSRCAPPITGDITIIGAGSSLTSLEAQGSCGYFQVKTGGSLTLLDITISSGTLDGSRAGPGVVQRGAAIYNEGLVRIERSIFRGNGINDNLVYLSGGGAIYNAPNAKAYLSDVEFLYNSVKLENYGGAAILNEGIMMIARSHFHENNGRGGIIANGIPGSSSAPLLLLSDSIIEGNYNSTGVRNGSVFSKLLVENTTIRGGDAVEGGGIYNKGEATVRESTIVRNRAIRGGGIYSAERAKTTLINTTISQNYARGKLEGNGIGGGIYNYGGNVYLANSTIASNTSQGLGSAIAATSAANGSAHIYIKGSLIVGHSNTTQDQSCYDFGPNDQPKILLLEHNLITKESNCYPSATDTIVNEATTFTEVIGPLSDYGSPTPAYVLLSGSPAIDKEGALCTDFDGMPIVIDQQGKVRTGCDIGSVDSTAVTPPIELKLKLVGNPPSIQPNSTGKIDLAILSRVDSTTPFRPISQVERSSIKLGAAGALPYKFISQDINGDGIADLVMRFKISDIGIACGDNAIELRGTILKGAKFVSSTAIATTGCSLN